MMKRQLPIISLIFVVILLPAAALAQTPVTLTPDVNLRLRDGPGTGYAQIGSVPAGMQVPVLGRDAAGYWAYVDYQSARGWVAAWLSTLDGDFDALPVTQPDGTGALRAGESGVTAPPPAGERAIVIRVIDGDTIEVLLNRLTYRVRYIGVDTPETYEPCYDEATAANRTLVGGQTVTLVKDISETDRYGRLLRYVYVGDVFVNAELAAGGYAQASTYPPDVAHADLFAALAAEARAAGRGCWAASAPAPEPAPSGGGAVCDCSGNIYNCGDFGGHDEAQACYQYCLSAVGYDVHGLDGDSDGSACEVTSPAPEPQPAEPAPSGDAVCNCSGNVYNCGDFGSHSQAQACYQYCLGTRGYDVHRLDGDNDGSACESLP